MTCQTAGPSIPQETPTRHDAGWAAAMPPLGSAAVLLLVVFASACGGAGPGDDPYARAAEGVCDASAQADLGNIDRARRAFYDTAHQPLHDLAADLTEVDRVLAARLLEAKESVESGFVDPGPGFAESLKTLAVATDDALEATGHQRLPCAAAGP